MHLAARDCPWLAYSCAALLLQPRTADRSGGNEWVRVRRRVTNAPFERRNSERKPEPQQYDCIDMHSQMNMSVNRSNSVKCIRDSRHGTERDVKLFIKNTRFWCQNSVLYE